MSASESLPWSFMTKRELTLESLSTFLNLLNASKLPKLPTLFWRILFLKRSRLELVDEFG